ncbi:MAG: hypothetical protein V1798_10755, partial [Pseudomonadota bacterium]
SVDTGSPAGYRLTESNSMIPDLTDQSLDCNASFVETNRINSEDVVVTGHTKFNVTTEGTPNSCYNKIFRRPSGGAWQTSVIPNTALSCQNAALDDLGFRGGYRTDAAVDVALACGTILDMDPMQGGNGTYRGTRVFLNDGTGNFVDFEAAGTALFNAVAGTMNKGTALVFDGDPNFGGSKPGAFNAVAIGDLDLDGVPDLWLGNGQVSVNGPNVDMFFKHLLGTGSLRPPVNFYRATPPVNKRVRSGGGGGCGGHFSNGVTPYCIPFRELD